MSLEYMERAMLDRLTSVPGLRHLGFRGFRTVANLRDEDPAGVPGDPGVYLVIRTSTAPPHFLTVGTGGWFKGKDPNVSCSDLKENWVPDALILYVGQAGSGSNGTLRKRIDTLIRFGKGSRIGHRGGRYLWQIHDADELTICWKVLQDDDPRDVKRKLILSFKMLHEGRRPFANLQD